jgi:hypothetical protein
MKRVDCGTYNVALVAIERDFHNDNAFTVFILPVGRPKGGAGDIETLSNPHSILRNT